MPQQKRLPDTVLQTAAQQAEYSLHMLAEHINSGGDMPQHVHDAIVEAVDAFATAKSDKPKPGVA